MVPVFSLPTVYCIFFLIPKNEGQKPLNNRLLSCYTIIKRWLLPSTLYSCIRTTTSLFSLNHYFGTLFYAHGCFRLDYPPYHEQSEFSASIHVIPRLTTNGKVSQPPNYALSLAAITAKLEYGNQCCTCVNLAKESYLYMFRGVPAISQSDWPFTYNPQLIGQYCNIDPFGLFTNLAKDRSLRFGSHDSN